MRKRKNEKSNVIRVSNGRDLVDIDRVKFPHICELIETRRAFLDENILVGIASDGLEIDLGAVDNDTEIYLTENPTTKSWIKDLAH